MSYINNVLATGEVVEYRARLSWVGYIPGLLLLPILPIGLALLIIQLIKASTTEIAITSSRLIMKTGLISRHSTEIALGRVESVSLEQSVPGRLLNYGTVTVRGTGIGALQISGINSPLELQRRLAGLAPAHDTRWR